MKRQRPNIRKREDTGRFEVNYRDADGKRRWMTFRTRKEAERGLRQKLAEVDAIRAGVAAPALVEHRWEETVLQVEDPRQLRSLGGDP